MPPQAGGMPPSGRGRQQVGDNRQLSDAENEQVDTAKSAILEGLKPFTEPKATCEILELLEGKFSLKIVELALVGLELRDHDIVKIDGGYVLAGEGSA